MTKAKSNRSHRRRSNATKRVNRRRTHRTTAHRRRTHRSRTNPTIKYVYRYRKNRATGRKNRYAKRRNPGGESTGSLIQTSVFGAAGAVLSRLVPNWVLGSANTGVVGYAGNVIAGLTLAWAGRKFISRNAGNAAMVGAGIALVLRLVQDFTPWGAQAALSGYGDAGMGILMPTSFPDPALYTGVGAARRIPPGWGAPPPAMVPANGGMKGVSNTYGQSTYGRS